MSITTKTGDSGTTGLMFNRRISKCHPRMEALGCVDELNSALGVARAVAEQGFVQQHLYATQKDLVALMGELATLEEDWPRYVQAGFQHLTPEKTQRLDHAIKEIEAQQVTFAGWAFPGDNIAAAYLEMARTICRRAERRICALGETQLLPNPEILIYLNRLSDLLWLLARWVEGRSKTSAS